MNAAIAYAPWICSAVAAAMFVAFWRWPEHADAVVMGALAALIVSGSVKPEIALAGFSNSGVITIGMLFIIAAGLRESGAMHSLGTLLLREPRSPTLAQISMTVPVAGLSAFVANTPVVALYLPLVQDWATRHRLPVSRLLMPLSFAAVVGGSITLIGSSVNLVANSVLMELVPGDPGLGFWEPALLGLPVAMAALLYMHLAQRLLPLRQTPIERARDVRLYSVELAVHPASPAVDKSVTAAGLRNLNGVFLTEIMRKGELIAPVEPSTLIRAHDRLIFVGDPARISDLLRIPGLDPPSDRLFNIAAGQRQRHLYEAVVSLRFPALTKTIRESEFRSAYDAAIIAVSRDGREIQGRLGDIKLQPGDVLLLDASADFGRRWAGSPDFLLLHPLGETSIPVVSRPRAALAAVAVMILGNMLGLWTLLAGSMLAAAAMILTRCLPLDAARKSLDLNLLVVIAGAIGIGKSLEASGVLNTIAGPIVAATQGNEYLFTAALFALAALVTTFISNAAAVALILPLALAAAGAGAAHGATLTVLLGASAGFLSPLAYQTNLMIMGPGGYNAADFLRFGAPLVLISGLMTTVLVPILY